ncbi:hypothetical protein L1987_49959 [Smallanthus sonchifolius]|uniref:Uncharacterized protein n=1 Tax=Smallanthus sonchifolius TaxID=185202 RepID=A0ACB9FWQ6_9ASTR|nr:hypothetical protein L1987_49959 [Smallanthus sonchifolius]
MKKRGLNRVPYLDQVHPEFPLGLGRCRLIAVYNYLTPTNPCHQPSQQQTLFFLQFNPSSINFIIRVFQI